MAGPSNWAATFVENLGGHRCKSPSMLAPRKTLWSTPEVVVDAAIQLIGRLQPSDKIIDIGCGDGRVLLQWAASPQVTRGVSLVGVDIDEERIQSANAALNAARQEGTIDDDAAELTFLCANALEAWDKVCLGATIFFLYLIPRGLRRIQPLLLKHVQDTGQSIRVLTYMAPLPGCSAQEVVKVSVPHQPGATWPLYYYEISS